MGEITASSWVPKGIFGFAVYTVLLLALFLSLPEFNLHPGAKTGIIVVGTLAIWRYGWGLTHYIRALIYKYVVFPRWRRVADAHRDDLLPPHIYLLVTSFRIEAETTISVFRATIAEAIACGIPCTVVASIVELADEFLVKHLFQSMNPPDHVTLDLVRIPGTGKRDGLAQAFRAISRDAPESGSIVAVIDGDSVLEEGLILKTVPFFRLMPDIGALTTDEICEVKGSDVMREWHDLRFAQRQILMCSMGLSRKVLTLTGRMSMFRADIITHPDFIAGVENDTLDHWRLGKFKFLTGDDKSSWYWVLKQGWNMLYVPDVVVSTVEHPPSGNFYRATTQLMFRWFGNMLRTNGRALALGPQKIGLFTWWTVLDQRISMWTSLTGPVLAVMLALKHSLMFLPLYVVWIGFTRWVMTVMLFVSRQQTSWRYPFLIYYNQVYGSLIKTFVFFRLDRQSWTRQKTTINRGLSYFQQRLNAWSSVGLHMTALLCFISGLGLLSGLFVIPDMGLRAIFAH